MACNLEAMGFYVYVDESGDEGFKFKGGSSEWFVLSAVIVPDTSELEIMKRVVDGTRAALRRNGVPKNKLKTLHFRDLKHEQRLPYIHRISKEDQLTTVVVLIDKTKLTSDNFRGGHELYFYGVRLLLERVSWFCKNASDNHGARIYFSNRGSMSYDDLKRYFVHLSKQKTAIDWAVLDTNEMFTLTAGQRMGLMVADAVASSYFYAVEASSYGFTETRYASMLLPRAFRGNSGNILGYGVKFFPENPDIDDLAWLAE